MMHLKYKNTFLVFLFSLSLGAIAQDQNNDDLQQQEASSFQGDEDTTRGCCDNNSICATNGTFCSLVVKGSLSSRSFSTNTLSVSGNGSVGGNLVVNGTITNASGTQVYGATGATGGTGATGAAGVTLDYASFFALIPTDNAATIAVGAAVQFPQNGPTSAGGITRTSSTTFQLAAIGTYEVTWQVSVSEPGQLVLQLNSADLANTVVGRATGTDQIVGSTLITTSTVNSVLSVNNPSVNSTALTITPFAGGSLPVSATLTIKRIA